MARLSEYHTSMGPSARPPSACRPAPWRWTASAALLALLARPASAPALDYHVDPVSGVNDAARDGLMPGTAWRTISYALTRLSSTDGPHVLNVAAGECSAASGESFPLVLPDWLSIAGAGSSATRIVDTRITGDASVFWSVGAGGTLDATRGIRDLAIERRPTSGAWIGKGLYLQAVDAIATPALTNLVITGAETGILLDGVSRVPAGGNAAVSPTLSRCVLTNNQFGLQAFAYTSYGGAAAANPTLVNSVISGNVGDGLVFATEASPDLRGSALTSATASPVITHCTIADNVGSGVLLDSYNSGYRAGPIRPAITNSILTGNGDFALLEFEANTDPASFRDNLVGGNLLGFYLDENVTYILTIAALNNLTNFSGNVDATPSFVRGLTPDWHLRGDSAGTEALPLSPEARDLDDELRPIDSDGDGTPVRDMGADEAQACAVNADLQPAAPADRCGVEGPLVLDASASAMAAGFTCGFPLAFEWYEDGALVGTDPTLTFVPARTARYTVVVTCPGIAWCRDAREVTVVVHDVPAADAGGPYDACIPWDAPSVSVDVSGTATPPDGTSLQSTRWTSTLGTVLGAALLDAQVLVDNTGENQVLQVTLTATDQRGCATSSTTDLRVWRGPRAFAGGPYSFCQDPLSTSTWMPLSGSADLPAGSAVVSWSWTTSVGRFDDPTSPTPRLQLSNLPFTRTANVSVTVTDDHGCAATSPDVEVRLVPSPTARAGGPYQSGEDAGGTTSFVLDGSASTGQAPLGYLWTTDLGTFRDTGTTTSALSVATLDIVNTGTDQTANVTLAVTDASTCTHVAPVVVSILTRPPLPPNAIDEPFLVAKQPAAALLSWGNSPLDATHDLAAWYEVWESTSRRPVAGTWILRAGLENLPQEPGTTDALDAALLDTAGPDHVFLFVIAANVSGRSCADPAVLLPACP